MDPQHAVTNKEHTGRCHQLLLCTIISFICVSLLVYSMHTSSSSVHAHNFPPHSSRTAQYYFHSEKQKSELQQLLLNHSSEQAAGADMDIQNKQKRQEKGILCTVLRNEAQYVSEWVAFHLLMGATTIVLYDDNSTDNLADAVAPFGESVVVVDLAKEEGVPEHEPNVHRVAPKQSWAIKHCQDNYAPRNSTGWFGVWDVDEFVFPCVRTATDLWGSNVLWDAWNRSTPVGADAHQLKCSIYGVNEADEPQPPGHLVLANNIRRAADPDVEPGTGSWEDVKDGCEACHCCQVASHKTMYDLTKVHRLDLWTHGTYTEDAKVDKSWYKPFGGLCCNHYQFKTTTEAQAKAEANLNDHYRNVAGSVAAKRWYTTIVDNTAWQYLADVIDYLKLKSFPVVLPQNSR